MNDKRKVIVFIATSIDGFIARENGDINWLSIVEMKDEDYGYNEFIHTVDTVIMGRKTYHAVKSMTKEFPHKSRTCYVISRTLQGKEGDVEFYNGDITELIESLKNKNGKHIFIDGGSEIINELRARNLIDEYIISVLPILLGKGIRLFRDMDSQEELTCEWAKKFDSGLVQVKYKKKTG